MMSEELWFNGDRTVELRSSVLPRLDPQQLLIRSRASAISAGTELLAYRGNLPANMPLDSSIAGLNQAIDYPLRYGYAFAGEVQAIGEDIAREWLGKRVFSFQPHGTHAVAVASELYEIPDDISWEKAVLLPNMETAVTLVQDGAPVYGEQVFVQGGGVVGYLLALLLKSFPLESLAVIEMQPDRRTFFEKQLGIKTFAPQEIDIPGIQEMYPADIVFEVSGNPEALNTAIKLARFNGRIVVGSWYGNKTASIQLGESFHRSRIQILASQVSTVNPMLSGRWSKERRLSSAWKALRNLETEKLITHRFKLADAAKAYAQLDNQTENTLQVLFDYE